jgi:hypothetical protein
MRNSSNAIADQRQQVALMKDMGISFDPISQLAQLVNLINQSQAPEIQQSQFDRELAQRALQGDRTNAYQQGSLQNDSRRLDMNAEESGRSYDLNQRRMGLDLRNVDLNERKFNADVDYQKRAFDQNKSSEMQRAVLHILGLLKPGAYGNGIEDSINMPALGQMAQNNGLGDLLKSVPQVGQTEKQHFFPFPTSDIQRVMRPQR